MLKITSAIFIFLALTLVRASADVTQPINQAAQEYQQGRVEDAIKLLQGSIQKASAPKEKWQLTDLLLEICTRTYDYQCVAENWKTLANTADQLKLPAVTAARVVYIIAWLNYFGGNVSLFENNIGMDFSKRVADPITNPTVATQLFILNALVQQRAGHFREARGYIDRAFASLLRIDTDKSQFVVAGFLKDLIVGELQNHDTAGALRWLVICDPLIRNALSQNGFEFADYLRTSAMVLESVSRDNGIILRSLGDANDAFAKLQLNTDIKREIISNLSINRAAIFALQGNFLAIKQQMAGNPFKNDRDKIIANGKFTTLGELQYAAAETFFRATTGEAPDERWGPLFNNVPDWRLGPDIASGIKTYVSVAQAIIQLKHDREGARRLLKAAASERLAAFELDRGDPRSFPLPNLLDRVVLGLADKVAVQDKTNSDADQLIGSMELLNRNSRFTVSDTVAALAAQTTADERRATHAVLRLSDKQDQWQAEQLQKLVRRLAAKKPFEADNFYTQMQAQEFSDSISRLQATIKPAITKMPTLAELQTALESDEAFVGYVDGARLCVRKTSYFAAPIVIDQAKLVLDTKILLSAITAQNEPSEALDSQYPVEASIRINNVLFDGLDDCLKDVKHIILFPPGEVVGIPASVLLKAPPPKTAYGYDLSKAHWLVFDYAFSYVTSIRDFLSARALAQRPTGDIMFAGVGDPKLSAPLATGGTGSAAIALRSAEVGATSLKSLKELPDTRLELQEISKIVGPSADIRLGVDATEEEFRTLPLRRYQIIHFATHGLVRGDIPGLNEAALVFTPVDMRDEFNDGLLTASDVANLDLSARLVVLSACNTANFDPFAFTSQVQGLTSAFAAAGVPTAVVSLWSVESQTSRRLMTSFYRQALAPGTSASVAYSLQQAMIDTIATAPSIAFYHPRFWAPFIVMGDGGVRIIKDRPQRAVRGSVEIVSTGGEVLGATASSKGLVISKIGPATDGRHSSVVDGLVGAGQAIRWSIEDHKIGAGKIVEFKGTYYVAGSSWNGKSIPVLRAISDKGAVLWTKEIPSRFDSAVITSLEVDKQGIFLTISPLATNDQLFDLDLVRASFEGEVLAHAPLSHPPAKGLHTNVNPSVSTAMFMGNLLVAVSVPPTQVTSQRSDFGYARTCFDGSQLRLFSIDTKSLSTLREKVVESIAISEMHADGGTILYSGSEHEPCLVGAENPALGYISPDLTVTRKWKDETPFYGRVVAATSSPDGIIAIENVSAPIDVLQYGGKPATVATTSNNEIKHPSFLGAELGETAILKFDRTGVLRERDSLGNGLYQSAMGFIRTSSSYMIYGSDGFNPWLEPFN